MQPTIIVAVVREIHHDFHQVGKRFTEEMTERVLGHRMRIGDHFLR